MEPPPDPRIWSPPPPPPFAPPPSPPPPPTQKFFISPSFNSSSISSELLAVDSEYSNSLTSDAWRQFQLSKHLSNPNHPYSKFGCGNYETLTNGGDRKVGLPDSGTSPRPELLKFWERHYHASNFALCVMSRLPLPELEEAVRNSFGGVREAPEGWMKEGWKDVLPWGEEQTGVVREVSSHILERHTNTY